jgi:acyl-CoA thioester hydrolase
MERDDGLFMMVAEVNCRYRAPARFDDDVKIRTAIASASDKVIRFKYEILNQKAGQLLATGESVHVVTDRQLRPARLPKRYREIFR